MNTPDIAVAAPIFHAALAAAERILIVSHVNPDGDAVGCVLGMSHLLRGLGKQTIPAVLFQMPEFCEALPGSAEVIRYRAGDALPEFDLVVVVDTAAVNRLGALYQDHRTILLSRPLLVIDHHATNDGIGTANLVSTEYSSCAELVLELALTMGLPLSAEAATCLLMGLITDTQSFQIPSAGAKAMRRAATLIEHGADQQLIVRAVYRSIPPSTLRISGMALADLRQEAGGLYWLHISRAMLAEAGADEDASDDTVSRAQTLKGLRILALFREQADGGTKISLRSVPGIDVAAVAQRWGGGGHKQAAGINLTMPPHEAEAALLPVLRQLLSETAQA
jgi:bifunctional oligoribonuclease and PAP phosphatase NrnA